MKKDKDCKVNINPHVFVLARIWMAKFNGVETTIIDALNQMRQNPNADACVGHISLQLIKNDRFNYESRYASFWPHEAVEPDEVTQGQFYQLKDDLNANGEPDHRYVLFSLDNQALWNAMSLESLCERFPYYRLIDGSAVHKKVRKVYLWGKNSKENQTETENNRKKPVSCSGVVYDLITQVGYEGKGLRYLDIGFDITRDLLVTCPNNMIDLFKDAEYSERKKWPDTKEHKNSFEMKLVQAILNARNIDEFNNIHLSCKDLILHSKIIEIDEHKKRLKSSQRKPIANRAFHRDNNVQRPRIPNNGFWKMLTVFRFFESHPKIFFLVVVLAACFLGRYSSDIFSVITTVFLNIANKNDDGNLEDDVQNIDMRINRIG